MKRFPGFSLVLLAACGSGTSQADVDALNGPLTLTAGASIDAVTIQTITSRTDKAGGAFTASVSHAVKDDKGLVIVPSGSILHLTIAVLQPANDKSALDGKILVLLRAVTVGGREFPVSGEVTSMAHTLNSGIAAGAAVAVETANRDIVVAAGTPIVVTLRGPLTISFQ